MLTAYSPGNTLIHRLDVLSKILGFLGILILVFLFQDPVNQLGVLALTVILALYIKVPPRKITGMIIPLLPIIASIVIITAFTFAPQRFARPSSQAVLFYLLPGKHLGATAGGFLMGLTFFLRIWSMLIASTILTVTTSMDDFMLFCQRLKIPAEISLMLTMALRFIPTLDKKRKLILEAQTARGMNFTGKGIAGSIRSYLPIMVPLFINSIMMANSLSMAMLNRGYGLAGARTPLQERSSLAPRDWRTIFVIIFGVSLAVFSRFKLHLGIL